MEKTVDQNLVSRDKPRPTTRSMRFEPAERSHLGLIETIRRKINGQNRRAGDKEARGARWIEAAKSDREIPLPLMLVPMFSSVSPDLP